MRLQHHSGSAGMESTPTSQPVSQSDSSDHQTENDNAQMQMQTMQHDVRRAVYMVVYTNTPFKAHWAYFYPENSESTGTQVHVTGDVRGGGASSM
jgi:hypothetical protein